MPRPSRRHPPDRRPADLSLPEMDALHFYLRRGLGEIENFDMLDGLFTALHLPPEPIHPAIGYPDIFGVAETFEELRRLDVAERTGYLDLILRHWDTVADRLSHGGAWYPPVSDDPGNREADWARGFQLGYDVIERWWEQRSSEASLERCFPSIHHLLEDDRFPFRTAPPRLTDDERVRLIQEAVREIGQMYAEMRWRE